MISKPIFTTMRNILFLTLTISLIASTSIAATFYLDSNAGSDSNSGSATEPFKTISKVQSIVSAGDTVYFDSADTWTGISGLAVLVPVGGVTYIGDQWGAGSRATLKGNNNSRAVVYFNNDDPTYETGVIGFDCDAQDNNITVLSMFYGGSETNDMTGAIKRVERNLIHNNDRSNGWYYGLLVSPNSNNQEIANVEIHDNVVYDIYRTGLAAYPYDGCSGCTISNINITGNKSYNVGTSGHGHSYLIKNGVSNANLECNLGYDNAFHGIALEDYSNSESPSNLTVRYNVADSVYIQGSVTQDNFTVSNNTSWPGPPTATPAFDAYCAETPTQAPAPPANLRIR